MGNTPGMGALIQARLAPQVAHVAMTTGRRYRGAGAQDAAAVDAAVAAEEVLVTPLGSATTLAEHAGETLSTIKQQMYATALAALAERPRPLRANGG